MRAILGLGLAAAIALVAWRRRALSASGALAATVVGAAIFAGGGGVCFGALGAFFVTSTLLGRVGAAGKAETKREYEKGDTRDAGQVLANGGIAALAAVAMLLKPDERWLYAVAGALAAANGDTWATELGVLARGEPRSILTLRRVPRGTSGAVSSLGVAASVAGALVVAAVAALAAARPLRLVVAVTLAGTVGSLVDSLAGATVQQSFHCRACARDCETPVHRCGAAAEHRRGVIGFGNDAVNLVATVVGAALAAALS